MTDAARDRAVEVPGPNGPEMLRHLRLMRRSPPEFLAWCADRYGPVVRFPIPRSDVFFASDPVDVRRVLQGNHTAYGKRTIQYDTLALVTGNGLLTSEGEAWKRTRRLLTPAFHRELVDDMSRAICDISGDWARRTASRGGVVLDLDAAMLELSLHIVAATLFHIPIERASALVDAVMTALRVVVAKAQQPVSVPTSWPTPGNRRLTRSLATLDRAVDQLIAQRRVQPPGSDALWLLVDAMDHGGVSPGEVRDEVVTLIVAGHETVAATLTWVWAALASNPQVERCVHAEVDQLDDADLHDAAVLDELRYTRAVVDEGLRLWPPAWVITRRCLRDDMLSGVKIPSGATVILSPYVVHRDGRHWARAQVFDPERAHGAESPSGSGPLTYFPFGAGPRQCIGRDLALLEAPLVVAVLARTLQFRLPRPDAITADFGVTLRPKGGLPARVGVRLR